MITNIFKPIDEESASSLSRLNDLLEGEKFLAGLGYRCMEFPISSRFPVITDIKRAHYLMSSQEMWDETRPTDEKYFVGVVEDSVNRYLYYDSTEEHRRTQQHSEKMDEFCKWFRGRIQSIINEHRIVEYTAKNHSLNLTDEDIKNYFFNIFAFDIESYILRLVLGAYCGGIHVWPVAMHMLISFETGGIPCGWIGPEFEEGGVPQKCMQVLHFG